jgi:hypothetical protein
MHNSRIVMGIECYSSDSRYAGLTYGQWTVKWWQWALSIPADQNPIVDETGKKASESQPKDAWFLGGIFAEENETKRFPSRQCSVPSGIPILLPVINCESDQQYHPELKSDQDLLEHVRKKTESIEKKEFYINDELIPPQRVHSDPSVFELNVHRDFDRFHNGGYTRAAADGYWIFLKPLPMDEYTLGFSGSCEKGQFNSGATYRIRII